MYKNAIKDKIVTAAKNIARKRIMPTIELVLEEINHQHSYRSVQKYLNAWKIETLVDNSLNSSQTDRKVSFKENHISQEDLDNQIKKNEVLSSQLFDLEESQQGLEREFYDLSKEKKELEIQNQYMREALEKINQDRESLIENVTRDRDKMIKSLQNEIRSLNEAVRKDIMDMGYKSDEALMEEKVKNTLLLDKVNMLEKKLEEVNQSLVAEVKRNKPLAEKVDCQKALIDRFVSFEQLQIFENESRA